MSGQCYDAPNWIEELPDVHGDCLSLDGMSDDAKRVMKFFHWKFTNGAREHGPLEIGSRNWTREQLFENVDNAMYSIMNLIQFSDRNDFTIPER